MVTVEEIYEAYYDCRKNKRKTSNAAEFELHYEEYLHDMLDQINGHIYRLGRSICFVVFYPKIREVFAAPFRDRIIHHLVIRRLEPLFERRFIRSTYNCRKGKGVKYGIDDIAEQIKIASDDYTRDVYIGKFDCKGFFMSIRKEILWGKLRKFVIENYHEKDKNEILYLSEIIIMNCPHRNCILKCSRETLALLDTDKSIHTCGDHRSLPIGNLSSQEFANFYLDDFDHYMKWLFGFYGRYVDDFIVISPKSKDITEKIALIEEKLKEDGIILHPKKRYVQHYSRGVNFIDSTIKVMRIYTGNRTIHNFNRCIDEINGKRIKELYAEKAVCRINSYIGFLIHRRTYNIRKRILERLDTEWREYIKIDKNYRKISLKNQ